MRSIQYFRTLVGVLAIAAVGAVSGILWWESQSAHGPSEAYAQQTATADAARGNLAALPGAEQLSASFREVARALKPSVVSIRSLAEVKPRAMGRRGGRGLPPGLPPEFEQFFGGQLDDFGFSFPEGGEDDGSGRPQEREMGLGSGVIVSSDGYVITNNHVVANADKLEVVLSDKRILSAKVIGTDPKTDVAVLKIEATGLVAAPIGDSSLMQVGDWVIAIGSPFGLTQTVTTGIISATHRDDQGITDYDDFLQTDAAINPGNSGGPLLNLRGQVIGLNTAIASRSGGFNGIGFAIPSNTVDSIMKSIIKFGKVTRGFIGTSIGDITPKNAEELGVSAETVGAYVSMVAKGGPAEKGGIQPGDVVTGVNGVKITSSSQLRHMVAHLPPGESAKFEILRNGKSLALSIFIEEQTEEKLAVMSGDKEASAMGIRVEPIPADVAQEFGLSTRDGGVLVAEIDSRSQLRQYIRVGEVILAVNNQRVSTPEEFSAAIGKAQGFLRLLVRNATSNRIVTIQR
jgi:serine protease Do